MLTTDYVRTYVLTPYLFLTTDYVLSTYVLHSLSPTEGPPTTYSFSFFDLVLVRKYVGT